MWKWIAENWKPGNRTDEMKREWLENNNFTKPLASDCFFCEYAYKLLEKTSNHKPTRISWPECDFCPAAMVNRKFFCFNATYYFDEKPKAFYRKLLELDAKRKS